MKTRPPLRVCVHVHTCMQALKHISVRDQSQLWVFAFYLAWNKVSLLFSIDYVRWVNPKASEDFLSLHLSSSRETWITGMPYGFYMGFEDSNSSLHTCTSNALPTETSPQKWSLKTILETVYQHWPKAKKKERKKLKRKSYRNIQSSFICNSQN